MCERVRAAGTIDASELRTAMRAMGVDLSAEQSAKLLSAYDTNKSGGIDFAEFLVMVLSQASGGGPRLSVAQVRQMRATFEQFDVNRSGRARVRACACACASVAAAVDGPAGRAGTIDVRELGNAVRALGFSLSAEELRRLFTAMDRDGSGSVDFAEWCSALSAVAERVRPASGAQGEKRSF